MNYKLNDLCTITSSKRIFANEYTNEGIPFYRSKEIIELASGKNVSTPLYISVKKYNEIKKKFDVPKKGDILLTAVGTLGIPYFVNNDIFYFKDGNLMWFKNINNKCNKKYLFYYFKSNKFRDLIISKAIGSTQKAITIDTVKNIEISMRNLAEQQHIVDTVRFIWKLIIIVHLKMERHFKKL